MILMSIPSRSLREFSSVVFTDDIKTVEISFANNQILFRKWKYYLHIVC